jgi:hypothetical protein
MTDVRAVEEQYAAIWVRVFTGPHRDHGGWWQDKGQRPICVCGAVLAEPEKAAA